MANEKALYAKRVKIQARQISGYFQRLRVITIWVTLGIYFSFPWVTYRSKQAIVFDLPGRKFHFFNLTFWPQDFILLALTALFAIAGLFFITTLAGRIWCGYTCPQTVWTKIFMWVEQLTEGTRLKRQKLDKAVLNINKLVRRSTKHSLWILISFLTALTFVGYFTPIKTLVHEVYHFALGPWEAFWLSFFTLATYMNAGWMREQVCLYMCPYARFQSAMFDQNTMIISYDEARGEPRGSRKKGIEPSSVGLGSCIDCTLCVQVCPTGIDIREGLQMGCIGCAACIDACDQIMDKMEYPRGLIKYSSENVINSAPTKIFRTRLVINFLLLTIIASMLVYMLSTRIPYRLDVLHARNQLYRETVAGDIENNYTLKIINMSQDTKEFKIELQGIKHKPFKNIVRIESNHIKVVPVSIQVLPKDIKSKYTTVTFLITPTDKQEPVTSTQNIFIGDVYE